MSEIATMEITTVIGCRMRCSYCPQEKLIKNYVARSSDTMMSMDVFSACLMKIPKDVRIDFSGLAEPWLNPSCTDMLIHAHEQNYKIAVYTTCVGMKIADIEKIKSIPFEKFVIHLPDREAHAKLEISDEYLAVLEEIAKSEIKNLSFMTMGDLPSEVEKKINKYVPPSFFHSRAGNIIDKPVVYTKKLSGKIHCHKCGPLLRQNVLLPNGDVVLCCMDYGLQHVVGNLLHTDYDSLLRGREYPLLEKGLADDSISILGRECVEARKTKLNAGYIYQLTRQYRLGYKINSKIKKYLKNLKHL